MYKPHTSVIRCSDDHHIMGFSGGSLIAAGYESSHAERQCIDIGDRYRPASPFTKCYVLVKIGSMKRMSDLISDMQHTAAGIVTRKHRSIDAICKIDDIFQKRFITFIGVGQVGDVVDLIDLLIHPF